MVFVKRALNTISSCHFHFHSVDLCLIEVFESVRSRRVKSDAVAACGVRRLAMQASMTLLDWTSDETHHCTQQCFELTVILALAC